MPPDITAATAASAVLAALAAAEPASKDRGQVPRIAADAAYCLKAGLHGIVCSGHVLQGVEGTTMLAMLIIDLAELLVWRVLVVGEYVAVVVSVVYAVAAYILKPSEA